MSTELLSLFCEVEKKTHTSVNSEIPVDEFSESKWKLTNTAVARLMSGTDRTLLPVLLVSGV